MIWDIYCLVSRLRSKPSLARKLCLELEPPAVPEHEGYCIAARSIIVCRNINPIEVVLDDLARKSFEFFLNP